MRLSATLLWAFICGQAIAAEPFGRAAIEGADGIVPGQQVHVVVDIFAPEFFTSPPQYPLFEVPDALVTLPDDRAQNLVQTIADVQYSGIRRSYVIVPEKTGSFVLPEIAVDLGYSANGSAIKAQLHVALPAFEVVAAPDQTARPFAARDLTVTQSFDRSPSTLKAGDAVVRTIVVFAEDTQAMLIPPVDLGRAAGVAQYLKPPSLTDGVEQRGIGRSVETGSTRTETVVYTASAEGSFQAPAVSYQWFDLDAHAGATATLPAVDIVVAKAASTERIDPKFDPPGEDQGKNAWQVVLLSCAAVLACFAAIVAWQKGSAIRSWAERRRMSRRNSPRRRLRRLRTIIRVGPDPAIYRALQDWSGSLGFRSVSDWAEAQGNPRLSAQVTILERRLFRSRDMQLDRGKFADSITLAATNKGRARKSALPALNPVA
ncbi:BatD family protein [Rhizobium sp. WYCCWR 11128]|uniref:BatD family protein n=1 Tax=Rhizobium sp. WYCCWR 11128 TaxID=2749832 RepID=UPI0015D179A5|nr:BatD family protein [Rhizobium sp. WYCCWR 11128]NYT32756.1 BatD family protein [Rhizobium sp. WYCCWR 11128]